MGTSLFWDPTPDLYYHMTLGWAGTPMEKITHGGWWPGKDSTGVPWGTCGLHGAWDTGRYVACPSCSTGAPLVQFKVYPELPEPPPVLEVGFVGEEKPHRCPVCEGRGTVMGGFYAGTFYATGTAREECKACEGDGIVWRS